MTPNAYTRPPRCPDELLSSGLADWAVIVWLAVRSVQGGNDKAWAYYEEYGARCGKSYEMVRKAIRILHAAGWIDVLETASRSKAPVLRCTVPTAERREQDAHLSDEKGGNGVHVNGEKVGTPFRKGGNGVPERWEQGSHPYKEEPVQESEKEPVQAGPAGPASESGGEADDPLGFDAFWEAYSRKEGKKPARRAWGRLSRKARAAALAHVPAFVASTPEVRFRPHPATYLNERRWEDEALPPAREPARALPPLNLGGTMTDAEKARACAEHGLADGDFYREDTDTRTGGGLWRLYPHVRAERGIASPERRPVYT